MIVVSVGGRVVWLLCLSVHPLSIIVIRKTLCEESPSTCTVVFLHGILLVKCNLLLLYFLNGASSIKKRILIKYFQLITTIQIVENFGLKSNLLELSIES
jgi:hypothetical protein